MENKQNIVNELNQISPVVAQIGFNNPYQVPTGYFEGLADRLLQRVREGEGSAVLPEKKVNPYEVPRGYFENFAASVLQRIKASEAQSPKEELEALSPLLGGISKKTPFSMPEGYFEELTDNAMAGAKAIDFVNEELENLSPVMSSLKNKQVYEVPAGYFEQLPEKMLQKVKAQPARTVSMNFTRRVVRYAAAAVIAGLIVAAAWLYFGNSGTTKEPTLAGIEQISDEMLESYLENEAVSTPEANIIASNDDDIDSDDLKDLLADVSDEELQKYVDQYGAKDIVTN